MQKMDKKRLQKLAGIRLEEQVLGDSEYNKAVQYLARVAVKLTETQWKGVSVRVRESWNIMEYIRAFAGIGQGGGLKSRLTRDLDDAIERIVRRREIGQKRQGK